MILYYVVHDVMSDSVYRMLNLHLHYLEVIDAKLSLNFVVAVVLNVELIHYRPQYLSYSFVVYYHDRVYTNEMFVEAMLKKIDTLYLNEKDDW
jgi:hypothetical protein